MGTPNEAVTTFLLGAGVSRSASSHMPMIGALGDAVVELIEQEAPLPSEDRAVIALGMRRGLETYLTQLAEQQPHHDAIDRARAHVRMLAIVDKIADVIIDCQRRAEAEGSLPLVARLVDVLAIQRSRVLTLNYDALLETHFDPAVASVAGSLARLPAPWSLASGGHVVVGYPDYSDGWTGPTMRIFKLHGSINWFKHDVDPTGESFLGVRASLGLPGLPSGAMSWDDAGGRRPMIVAPTSQKSLALGNTRMRTIWQLARRDALESDRLVVIGYSFPLTDTAVGSLIGECFSNRDVEVVVVDPNAEQVSGRLEQTGLNVERCITYAGDDCVARFLDDEIDRIARTSLDRLRAQGISDDATLQVVPEDVVHRVETVDGDLVLFPHGSVCPAGDGAEFDIANNMSYGDIRSQLDAAERVWVQPSNRPSPAGRRRVVAALCHEVGPGELRVRFLPIR